MTGAHRGPLLRAVAVLLTWSVIGAGGVLARAPPAAPLSRSA
ncbi:hypothetical protein [Blastococcus aggregatus]|nr:hypothetical protein [Blastococcus aggregatus]